MWISSLLLPVTFVVDLFCIFWPLPGPFFPVDAVWAFANYQALNNSNTIMKGTEHGEIAITYQQNDSLLAVQQLLEVECIAKDSKAKIFSTTLRPNPATTDDLTLATAVGFGSSAPTAVLNHTTGLMTAAPQWPVGEVAADLRAQLKKSSKEYYSFVKKNHSKKAKPLIANA